MLYFSRPYGIIYEKGKIRRIKMKKIRLILAFILSVLALCIFASCTPIEPDEIDPNKTYTVSFDTDGGSEIPSQTVKRNESATLPDEPTKYGYTFAGWYSGSIAWDFDEYKIRKDTVLTAKWTVGSHTVSFIFEENGLETSEDRLVNHNATIKKLPTRPTKEGFVFGGWYYYGTSDKFDENEPVVEDITLVAKWACLVTFDMNAQGDAYVEQTAAKQVELGATLYESELGTPERENYKFDGWTYEDGTPWDSARPIEGNITLVAKWLKLCWVSFNTNGGERIEPYQVLEGTVIREPEIPYHYGHYFTGWYSKVDEFTLAEHDFTKPVTSNVKIEAKWVVRNANLIYDDQTHMNVILPSNYTLSVGTIITPLTQRLNSYLHFDVNVGSASELPLTVKDVEIVIGRSDREISTLAYEALERMPKSNPTDLRYMIFVDTVHVQATTTRSICIAYDEDADNLAMRLAINAFIENYLSSDTLILGRGTYLATTVNPLDYIQPSSAEYAIIDFSKKENA